MQGTTGQGNQNGQKQGGLSWTQSPSSAGSVSSNINNNNAGGAKPISQVQPSVSKAPVSNTPNKAPSMPSNSSSKKNDSRQGSGARTAGIFIAGVIVGLIIGWGWFSLGRDNGAVATNDNDDTTATTQGAVTATSGTQTGTAKTGTSAGGSGAVTASPSGTSGLGIDSQSAGLSVKVSSVSVSAPTWVVIYDNVNGTPGNALGARMFFPGETSGTIELLRATISGKSYFAGEYVDDGDHKYSKQSDSQVKTVAGTPLIVQFNAR